MSNQTLRFILFITMMLWCLALIAGSAAIGFIGMLFAGEPGSGAGVTASEFLEVGTPLLLSIALTIGLITLWVKRYYKTALVLWVASLVLAAAIYAYVVHGLIL